MSTVLRNERDRRAGTILWIIIAVSLLIHAFFLIASRTFLYGRTWVHHPVHACVEFSGALIAFLVAVMLLSQQTRGKGTSFNVWIAGALIGMGILDGMHAAVIPGHSFVWLHSTATFVGGSLFALVWLPASVATRVSRWWHWAVFFSSLLFGALSIWFSDWFPVMLRDGKFTIWARGLNIAGGVLLFAAAVRLVRSYLKGRNVDDLLFCLHCGLFGSAAIMFDQSDLWDAAWWGWHLLRLLAYGVALVFVVITEEGIRRDLSTTTAKLTDLNATLEGRVQERTEALARQTAELARSNSDLEQFAYVASHDLSEPLRAVAGFTELLRDQYGDQLDDTAKAYMGHSVDGARRMQSLISSLLDFSRVGSSGSPIEPTDLNEAIRDALSNLSTALEECGGEVKYGSLPTVPADRAQIVRVFQNLIGNALKFRGEKTPLVEVDCQPGDGEWQFAVKDNGIGISPEHQERVFEIFRRLHGRGEYPGTGMGLTICERIIARHGGRIWIESEAGKGCCFLFTLPTRPADLNTNGNSE